MELIVLLSCLSVALAGPAATKRAHPAPLHVPATDNLIKGNYIVKMYKDTPEGVLDTVLSQLRVEPEQKFTGQFQGFASKLDAAALKALRMHPNVDYIEQDYMIEAEGIVTDEGSTWGLGRISHREKGSHDYVYDDAGTASGVCAYVIDTGIETTHPEFEGRAQMVGRFTGDDDNDNCGHGTHVSGTIGSKSYGVAKKVNLYGLKALELNTTSGKCSGPSSGVIAAMNAVSDDVAKRNCPNGVVVNMSLGGPPSEAKNDAARNLVNQGYFVAVAAGNDNANASSHSPGNTPEVCTVGGTAEGDVRYVNSNWGPLVDILAPAVKVLSTYIGNSTRNLTGTSMATPHVAGLAAYFASRDGIVASAKLCDYMVETATKDAITDNRDDTVNKLIFNGATS